MKKSTSFLLFLLIFGCETNELNQYCDIIRNETINLANPEFINIRTSGGWSYANGGPRGLILYNFGNTFKAFSRQCPHSRDCASQMEIVDDFKIVCPCDDAEFSIIDGSPQTAGITEFVCEFRVVEVGPSVLTVTNY